MNSLRGGKLAIDVAAIGGTLVAGGPIYIKDHLAASRLDHARLFALDLMGNVPFGGMVKASYLTAEDWRQLAAAAGYRIDRQIGGAYRFGVFERLFPNPRAATLGDYELDDVFGDLERDRDGRATMSVTGQKQRLDIVLGSNYRSVVIWSPKGRDFVCIEPMAGITDP